MKRLALISSTILFLVYTGHAQSRIYLSGGLSTSLGGSTGTILASNPTLPCFDLEWEKKIVGSMSLLTGVSLFGVGYSNTSTLLGNKSTFRANYVALPVMARWNMFNKNNLYLDFGILTSYLVKAHLQETNTKFGVLQTADGDISAYSNPLLICVKFQETITINRFTIVLFVVAPFKGQSTIKNLQDHWLFNQQQSTYLLSNGYSSFLLTGLKIGVRIK